MFGGGTAGSAVTHSARIPGLILGLGYCLCGCSHGFSHSAQKYAGRWTGYDKLSVGVSM